MRIRSVARAALGTVVLMALPGCAAATGRPGAPRPATPEHVRYAGDPSHDDLDCVVRQSFAAGDVKPAQLIGRKLVAGVDLSDATMSHWNAAAQRFEGFNIDLLLGVAAAIWPGVDPRKKITFEAVPPGSGSLDRLEPGNPRPVDVVATSLTATCARARLVYFSDGYLDSGQTALVRRVASAAGRRPEYDGLEALGGHRVCAAAATTSLTAITEYRTATGQALLPVQAEHSIDCLVMLRQRQVDAVSTDENILMGFARMAPDTMLVTQPPLKQACEFHHRRTPCTWLTDEPHAFAFGTDDRQLTRYVNGVLRDMAASGAWQRAHDRWLKDHPDRGFPRPGPAVTTWPPP